MLGGIHIACSLGVPCAGTRLLFRNLFLGVVRGSTGVHAEGCFRILSDSASFAGVVSGPTLVVGRGVTLFRCFAVLYSRSSLPDGGGGSLYTVRIEHKSSCTLFEFIAYLIGLNSNPFGSSNLWVAVRPSGSLAGVRGGPSVSCRRVLLLLLGARATSVVGRFARAEVGFVVGLCVCVGVSQRLREPTCGVAFTGAGLLPVDTVEESLLVVLTEVPSRTILPCGCLVVRFQVSCLYQRDRLCVHVV
ncbi:hypothetical protein Taro_036136 [Colocasia esculenta]|uniref:Uncharacterized protein n=1 Tax=Colocasia esculenta TaxID=4460 RepID=A0A843W7L7_COLES|nr:hypothetical protein [Colocasia esculenta]